MPLLAFAASAAGQHKNLKHMRPGPCQNSDFNHPWQQRILIGSANSHLQPARCQHSDTNGAFWQKLTHNKTAAHHLLQAAGVCQLAPTQQVIVARAGSRRTARGRRQVSCSTQPQASARLQSARLLHHLVVQ